MKLIPKLAGFAVGIVIALWILANRDTRHFDMVCDTTQVSDETCQDGFIEVDRLKRIFEINERRR
jgi:hypothetical protein